MRLIEFTLPEIFQKIEMECSQVLAEYRRAKKVLFRGIAQDRDMVIQGTSPTNRTPRDLGGDTQDFIDAYLRKKGFKALRSNSIFCTSDVDQSSIYSFSQPNPYSENPQNEHDEYGSIYVIFPKNGFAFTYCKAYDLAGYFHEHNDLGIMDSYDLKIGDEEVVEMLERKNTLDKMNFRNADLRTALKKGVEVYINGAFYGIQHIFPYRDKERRLKMQKVRNMLDSFLGFRVGRLKY